MKLTVDGGQPLSGTVHIQGAKNAGQKIIPAVAMLDSKVTIDNCSLVGDNRVLLRILEHLGAVVSIEESKVTIDPRTIISKEIPRDLTVLSTGTFVFAGAMLRRFGHVQIGGPGGDEIGSRPVDFHLSAFEALGAKTNRIGDSYEIWMPKGRAGTYVFPFKTANGTVNAVIVASGLSGVTVLGNPDRDPDIENFLELIKAAGAEATYCPDGDLKVVGNTARVKGPISLTMVPDRNDAATWLTIAATVGEAMTLLDMPPLPELSALVDLLGDVGVELDVDGSTYIVTGFRQRTIQGHRADIRSGPFPGVSTDWGPLIQVLLSRSSGEFTFTETVFAQRFAQVAGLVKMGAAIHYLADNLYLDSYRFPMPDGNPHSIGISGPRALRGATVTATDIRAGAALLVAALAANGETVIMGAEHLKRGYEDLPQRLRTVGAHVTDFVDVG